MRRLNVVRVQMVKDHTVSYDAERITAPEQAARAFRALVGESDREVCCAVMLDGKNDPLDSLYGGLKHGEWTLLKQFKKTKGSDGQDAEVYVAACPARFYKVVGLPATNSVGEPVAPFVMSTGSGSAMEKLACSIAEAAAAGMIGIDAPAAAPVVTPEDVMEQISQIAKDYLDLDTLETRNSDSLDFHDLSVWNVRDALLEAFRAGMAATDERQEGGD